MLKIKCPWCGHAYDDEEFEMYEDGELCDTDCDQCDKAFRIVLRLTKEYTITKAVEYN